MHDTFVFLVTLIILVKVITTTAKLNCYKTSNDSMCNKSDVDEVSDKWYSYVDASLIPTVMY